MAVRHRQQRRGTAAVEAAFGLTIVVILLLGTWEVGRLIEVQQILNMAVREAARQASTGQVTNTQAQQVAINYLSNARLPTQNVTVAVQNLTSPSLDASKAAFLDQLQITATMPFSDVRWAVVKLVTSNSTQLSAQATWCSAVGQQYPTNITAPGGF